MPTPHDPRDDAALLAAWRGGEQAAGFHLFNRHYVAVARFFHAKVGVDSADLVQRTFLGCVEGMPRFRDECTFRSFLFAIAYRQLCQFLRDSDRQRRRLDFIEVSLADVRPSATAEIGQREEIRLMLAAVRQIPLEFQVLLELHYSEGVTTGELAEILGVPPSTARARMIRARELLAAKMTAIAVSPALADSTATELGRWITEIRGCTPTPPRAPPPSPLAPGKPR